jgi:hypothetical protein
MSILYATVSFEDIYNQNCPDTYVDALCDVFSNMVKKVARMPARTAMIALQDINVIAELKPFILTIDQRSCHGIPLWHGIFVHGSMQLRIIATLEKQK